MLQVQKSECGFFAAARKKRNTAAQNNGKNGENNAVYQVVVEKQPLDFAADDEPNIFIGRAFEIARELHNIARNILFTSLPSRVRL